MSHLFFVHRQLTGLGFCLLLLAAAGCADLAHKPLASDKLPAHYQGTLPCTDCAGVDYDLLLSPDHAYVLRRHYESRQPIADAIEIGHWRLQDDHQQLALTPSDTDAYFTSHWRVDDDRRLTALGKNGQPVDSDQNYSLTRTATANSRSLAGPHWVLVDAPDQPGSAPAYLHFDQASGRLTGFTGCNRLMAHYRHDHDNLRVEPVATARRACQSQNDTEEALQETLRHTQHYKSLGDFLLLYGSANDPSPLAVFQADAD